MKATVIDTLRYANRLKRAGVETGQAEAMSRALNDELTGGLATKADLANAVATTKADLDNAVSELSGRIDALDAKFEVKFAAVEARFAGQDGKFEGIDAKFEGIDAKFAAIDGKFAAVDARFDAVDTKFDALRSQNRYVFLVLALIAGLGLYNATAPHFLGRVGQVPATESAGSAPAVQAPNVEADSETVHGPY